MGWIDGWASGHNPLRSLSGAGGHHDPLRRCCFCAVMGTRQRFPLYALSFVRITGYGCPHQAHECRTLCAQMSCLLERLCEAKYSELYPGGRTYKRWASPVCKCALSTSEDLYLDSEKGMMVLFLGALRPLFLGVEHRGQYEPPQRTEKADVGSRTRQVVLTEPCGSVSVIRWIIATLRVLLVASLSRCEPLTLACPLMGYVCRFVAM